MSTKVKAALAAPCFLEGQDLGGNNRLDRNVRYIEYYSAIKNAMGFEDIWLLDNASDPDLYYYLPRSARIHSYSEHLVHGPDKHDYPYCWRALYDMEMLFKVHGYTKVIFADSDGFVLSHRLANFIKDCNSGWVSFRSTTHEFPEASLQILNLDALPIFQEYTKKPWQFRNGCTMERDLPFTDVITDFNVGRFGETGSPPQDASMDWYGQASLSVPLEYGKYI